MMARGKKAKNGGAEVYAKLFEKIKVVNNKNHKNLSLPVLTNFKSNKNIKGFTKTWLWESSALSQLPVIVGVNM